jgi:hypothetical protein
MFLNIKMFQIYNPTRSNFKLLTVDLKIQFEVCCLRLAVSCKRQSQPLECRVWVWCSSSQKIFTFLIWCTVTAFLAFLDWCWEGKRHVCTFVFLERHCMSIYKFRIANFVYNCWINSAKTFWIHDYESRICNANRV